LNTLMMAFLRQKFWGKALMGSGGSSSFLIYSWSLYLSEICNGHPTRYLDSACSRVRALNCVWYWGLSTLAI
jgi:hypothetical protein